MPPLNGRKLKRTSYRVWMLALATAASTEKCIFFGFRIADMEMLMRHVDKMCWGYEVPLSPKNPTTTFGGLTVSPRNSPT